MVSPSWWARLKGSGPQRTRKGVIVLALAIRVRYSSKNGSYTWQKVIRKNDGYFYWRDSKNNILDFWHMFGFIPCLFVFRVNVRSNQCNNGKQKGYDGNGNNHIIYIYYMLCWTRILFHTIHSTIFLIFFSLEKFLCLKRALVPSLLLTSIYFLPNSHLLLNSSILGSIKLIL